MTDGEGGEPTSQGPTREKAKPGLMFCCREEESNLCVDHSDLFSIIRTAQAEAIFILAASISQTHSYCIEKLITRKLKRRQAFGRISA